MTVPRLYLKGTQGATVKPSERFPKGAFRVMFGFSTDPDTRMGMAQLHQRVTLDFPVDAPIEQFVDLLENVAKEVTRQLTSGVVPPMSVGMEIPEPTVKIEDERGLRLIRGGKEVEE